MRLPEYPERTLYTTWDVSYAQLTCQNPEAAKLLTLLAYFDNQCVWYKLLLAGSCAEERPSWFANITKDIFAFEDAIAALVDYCFVEAHHTTKSYSVHVCVHDWILECLNCNVDLCQYWFAFDCVAFSINQDNEESLSALSYRPLAAHALRLVHHRFKGATDPENLPQHKQNEVLIVAKLLHEQDQYKAAEQLYLRALASREKSRRADDVSDPDIINSLGNLYRSQGNLAQSEEMYLQALAGRENQLGPDDILTLRVVNNLGALYVAQGRLTQAEQRYQRALAGKEDKLGPDDISTLSTVNNMGVMYDKAGRLAEAEEMYKRALAGREKQLKRNHCSTLKTINNLGALYAKQGKFAQAEEMYQIALAGKEETVGADHISTIKTIGNLGELYHRQGRLAEAAGMYERAWAGRAKVFGLEDPSTRLIEDELEKLHLSLGQRWSELKRRWGHALK
jgi:tetratricopeptide (TPR) repeat protein